MTLTTVASAQNQEVAAFWSSFWPSFWSGSASGVITGVITGLVVGFILLRYQRDVEERASVKVYGRELSIKLDELRGALTQDDVLSIDSVRSAVPKAAAAAIAILKDSPLTLWREALPEYGNLLNLAIDLQKSYASFNALADEADQILGQRVRAFNHQRGAISANDPVYRQLGVGMLFGSSIDQLLPWLASHGPTTPEPYVAAWAQISQHARLAELAPLLEQARESLKNAAQKLLSAVDA